MGQPERESDPRALGAQAERDGPAQWESAAVEPRIVRAALAGDQDAWSELVHAYTRRLYALAYSRLRQVDLAEEVVQSVFATVANKVSTGGYAEQGQFEAWLFRIAVNRIRDQIRIARRSKRIDSPEALREAQAEPAATADPDSELLVSLKAGLGELSDKDREIIELRHHGQMSFKQIASMLDEPVGTLLARHHRALAKLRDMLSPSEQATADSAARPAAPNQRLQTP